MKKSIAAIALSIIMITSLIPSSAYAVYTDGPSNSSYNRTNAATYIYTYTGTPNSAYYDYTNDGGDCTNFVSQVLCAGGMPMTPAKTNPTTNDWYYYGPAWGTGRTSTWTGAHSFRQYWADVNGVGAKKANAFTKYNASDFDDDTTWNTIYSYLEAGDIVQYYSPTSGTTYHSQAVHRTSYENGEFKVSMGQHTSNNWKNLRSYVTSLSDDTVVCLIKIKEPARRSSSLTRASSYGMMSVNSLTALQDDLFYSVPQTEDAENEKWAQIAEINDILINRADANGETFSVKVTSEVLYEIITNRLENNTQLIQALSDPEDGLLLPDDVENEIQQLKTENVELNSFMQKASETRGVANLWNDYWNKVVQETPPAFYVAD